MIFAGGVATRAWPGTGRPATGRKQNETAAAATTQKPLPLALALAKTAQAEKATGGAAVQQQACPRPELALPKDWSYR
jgi:hypothetical protein